MSIEEICAEVKRFSPEEKGRLVASLISDMGRTSYDVSDEEVAKRVRGSKQGLVQDLTHDELLSGLQFIPKI